jgi:hypothetical protein
MPRIEKTFVALMDDVIKKSERTCNDVSDYASTICKLKNYVKEISNSTIQQLAEKKIGAYLTTLEKAKVDFFKLDVALAQEGTLGAEVSASYSQFEAVRLKLFNKITAHIDIAHALKSLQELNPDIDKARLDKLEEHSKKFEKHFDFLVKKYMIHDPVQELVQRTTSKTSSKRAACFSADDLVECLAAVFATWTILKSRKMYTENNNDDKCVLKPHPVQLVAIFRMLNLDAPTGFWSSVALGIGLKLKIKHEIPGQLIQVYCILLVDFIQINLSCYI